MIIFIWNNINSKLTYIKKENNFMNLILWLYFIQLNFKIIQLNIQNVYYNKTFIYKIYI